MGKIAVSIDSYWKLVNVLAGLERLVYRSDLDETLKDALKKMLDDFPGFWNPELAEQRDREIEEFKKQQAERIGICTL